MGYGKYVAASVGTGPRVGGTEDSESRRRKLGDQSHGEILLLIPLALTLGSVDQLEEPFCVRKFVPRNFFKWDDQL